MTGCGGVGCGTVEQWNTHSQSVKSDYGDHQPAGTTQHVVFNTDRPGPGQGQHGSKEKENFLFGFETFHFPPQKLSGLNPEHGIINYK